MSDNEVILRDGSNNNRNSTLSLSCPSSLNSEERTVLNSPVNQLNIACANARSIVEKIDSLIELSDINSLHFTILTETWLTGKHCPPRVLADLTTGANLSFIRRDRGSRGGGVAISYNPTLIRLANYPVKQVGKKQTELVCATGNCTITKRKIAVMSIYLPPSMKSDELEKGVQLVIDTADKIKTSFPDALFFIGGDFNGKNITQLTTVFPKLEPLLAGNTRKNKALDEIYSNCNDKVTEKLIMSPLTKQDGTKSDHGIIAATFSLPKHKKSSTTSFSFRPVTTEGVESLARC